MPFAQQTSESLAKERIGERRLESDLGRLIGRANALLIALAIAAIAYGDWLTGQSLSIGFLYLIPLSLCALTQSRLATIGLIFLCLMLRHFLGPLQAAPTEYFVRDLALAGLFISLVAPMMRFRDRRQRFFEEARRQRDELIDEVRMAAAVQHSILLRNQPPQSAWDIVARMDPAKVVGGDYYDFIEHLDGTLGIVIADVAGKGLPAAMLMPAVDITIQASAQRSSDPAKALGELNKALYENTGAANYATVFYASLETASGRLRYANGGHLPGLILRAGSDTPEWLSDGGPPVGLLPNAAYEVAETCLDVGDIFALYSDGVVEEQDREREQFGSDRLVAAVLRARAGSADEVVEAVWRDLRDFRAGEEIFDDTTVILIKAPGALLR